MNKKYMVDWNGDGEDVYYFKTKKEAISYLEKCSGVYIEEVTE